MSLNKEGPDALKFAMEAAAGRPPYAHVEAINAVDLEVSSDDLYASLVPTTQAFGCLVWEHYFGD